MKHLKSNDQSEVRPQYTEAIAFAIPSFVYARARQNLRIHTQARAHPPCGHRANTRQTASLSQEAERAT